MSAPADRCLDLPRVAGLRLGNPLRADRLIAEAVALHIAWTHDPRCHGAPTDRADVVQRIGDLVSARGGGAAVRSMRGVGLTAGEAPPTVTRRLPGPALPPG